MICNKSEFTSPARRIIGWGRALLTCSQEQVKTKLLRFAALATKNIPEMTVESEKLYAQWI